MIHFKKLAIVVALSSQIIGGCDMDKSANEKLGQVVFSDGSNSISRLRFHGDSKSIDSLVDYSGARFVNHVSKEGLDSVLVSDCSIQGSCSISRINLVGYEVTYLRAGRVPVYSREHNTLYFYDEDLEDRSVYLFKAPLDNVHQATRIVKAPDRIELGNGIHVTPEPPAVPISDNEVIVTQYSGKLSFFNINTSEMVEIDGPDCYPVFLLSSQEEILCSSYDQRDYFLFNLKSNDISALTMMSGAFGVIYVADTNLILYSKTRTTSSGRETSDVFQLDLDSKMESRLIQDIRIAVGVWIEDH